MSASRAESGRHKLLLGIAGTVAAGLLLGAIALLVRESDSGNRGAMQAAGTSGGSGGGGGGGRTVQSNVDATAAHVAGNVIGSSSNGAAKRFTLRLGEGFRFKDGAVVVGSNRDERPDIVFKYLPPQVGGMATRYNPISQQVETGLEPTLTAAVPLLVSTHIAAFDEDKKPNVARITSGDAAAYFNQAPLAAKSRYVLLMNSAGDQYLLTMDQLEAQTGKYDDWRIGFSYQSVQLPLGLAGGRINTPLPGKIIFRDWYRVKMIVRVDLTSGKEEAIADGTLPSTALGERILGYGDQSSAFIVREAPAESGAAGTGGVAHSIRFNEQVMGPVLSPDGTRLAATVYRAGPEQEIGGMKMPGRSMLSVAVFDLDGHEMAAFVGYDDATWTPDGKQIIATGALTDPGLFELDVATKTVTPIDAKIASPYQPCVSPDGKTIAFVTGQRVWLIDRAPAVGGAPPVVGGGGGGKNLRQLFLDGNNQQRPAFSPDGGKIAFIICNTLAIDVTGEVFVLDLKTQELTPLRTNMGATLVPDSSSRLNWVP